MSPAIGSAPMGSHAAAQVKEKPPKPHIEYRREIDGLRALAVLPVILFHAGFDAFSGGFVGVDVFFVISGYLITSIIIAERAAGTFSIAGFYERRARRILPALFLVMALCIPAAWLWLLPADMQDFAQSAAAVTVFSSNVLFWVTSGYFDSAAEMKPLLHTWSLGVEEQFYLFFPLVLVFLWRFRLLLWPLAALASLALAQWAAQAWPVAAFFLLPTRAWELLLGAMVALYLSAGRRPGSGAGADLAAVLGLLLILYATFAFDAGTPFPGLPALLPTVGALLIILCAGPGTWTGRMLGTAPLVMIGLVSYSAYLWHQPLMAFARHRGGGEAGPWLLGALAALSLPLAWLSWKYVEAPFRRRQNFTRRQVFGLALAGSAAFAAFGLAGHLTEGFKYPWRFRDATPEERAMVEATLPGNIDHPLFFELRDRPFDATDPRPRVLLIGDSYGQDLAHAMQASGLLDRMQLSTRQVIRECGNLFLEQSRFIEHVPASNRSECGRQRIFEDETLRRRMLEADEIWLASAWQDWQVQLVPESVEALQAFSGRTVRVFGRKHFGEYHLRSLLVMEPAARYALRHPVPPWHTDINRRMRQLLSPDVFIDVQSLLCGAEETTCPPFRDRQLLSFDGTHLTDAGARFYAHQLIEHTPVGRFAAAGASPAAGN